MSGPRSISKTRLKIYNLAIDGECQKTIGQTLELSRSSVSEHITALLAGNYLKCKNPGDKVLFYEKGPKGKILDEAQFGVCSENLREGREPPHVKVRTVEQTPNYVKLPPNCQVHSHGVRAKVVKIGDIETIKKKDMTAPFLKAPDGKMKNNVEQYFGKVELPDGSKYSVKYQESENTAWFYVWVQGEFTREEMETLKIDEVLMAKAQDVFNHVQRYAGWQFGIIEAHRGSKTHYVVNSTLTDEISQRMPKGVLISTDKSQIDDTPPREDGQPTFENTDQATATNLMVDIEDLLADWGNIKVAIEIMGKNQTLLINDSQITKSILSNVVTNQEIALQNQKIIMKILGLVPDEAEEAEEMPPPPEEMFA